MSDCGAVRDLTNGEESESHVLIDACLARVRIDARLDEKLVVPPLEVIVGRRPPPPYPGGHVARPVSQVMQRAEPPSSLRLRVEAPVPMEDAIVATGLRHCTVEIVQRMRWPVLLCGFLAGTFGGVALMKSPEGQRPAVQARSLTKHIEAHAMCKRLDAACIGRDV